MKSVIVDSITKEKAKIFVASLAGNESEIGIRLLIDSFCGKDPVSCYAVWKALPIGSAILNLLREKIGIISHEESTFFTATIVGYLMSSMEDQMKFRPFIKDLIEKYPENWLLIKDEPGLEVFTN